MIAVSRLTWFSTKTDAAPSPMRWSYRQIALTIGCMALLALAVLSIGDGAQLISAAKGLWERPAYLSVFLLTYTVAFFLRALAWRLLMPTGPSVYRLFAILQIALLANHLFPTKAGEFIRIGILSRRGVPVGSAASSTLLARLIDFTVVCLMALVLAPLAGIRLDTLMSLLALPMAALLFGALGLYVVASGKALPLSSRLPAGVVKVVQEARLSLIAISGVRLLAVFVVVVPSWLLEAGALWSVAQAAGVPLSLTVAIGATAFTIAFQGFQFTPGGLGVYEASLTGILVLIGVDPAAALALALATHALKFAYSYLVGFPCLVAEGLSSFAVVWRRLSIRRLSSQPFYTITLAALACLVFRSDFWASPTFWLGFVAGLLATVPLAVLSNCHHFPAKLSLSLLTVPLLFFALFGLLAPAAGLVALAVACVIAMTGGAKDFTLVFWPPLLTQSIAAGLVQPLAVGLFGLVALFLLVLVRQWWLARRPLSPPGPPVGSVLAVIVPVHNEATTIASVVGGIPRPLLREHGFETQVVVVDDGSLDGSGEIARAAGADLVITHPRQRGLGAAVRSGLAAAHGIGAAAAVYLDGDGEYDPTDIPEVAGPVLRGEADYVLGTRFPYASSMMHPSRRLGNRLFTLLVSLLAGRRLLDSQTGFRAFSGRALATAEIVHDYNYAQVLTLDLLRKRMRLAQIPIKYRTRQHGTSFIRYREYLRRVLPAIAREVLAP